MVFGWCGLNPISLNLNASKLNSSKGLGMMVIVEELCKKKDRLLPMNLFHKREQGSFFVLYVGGSLDRTALILFSVLQQLIQTL
jgi:hypothetical protein